VLLCALVVLAGLLLAMGATAPVQAAPYPPVLPTFGASAPLRSAGPAEPSRSRPLPTAPASPGTTTAGTGAAGAPTSGASAPPDGRKGLRNGLPPSGLGAVFVTLLSIAVLVLGGSVLVVTLTRRTHPRK
jgi:hypothetical protein